MRDARQLGVIAIVALGCSGRPFPSADEAGGTISTATGTSTATSATSTTSTSSSDEDTSDYIQEPDAGPTGPCECGWGCWEECLGGEVCVDKVCVDGKEVGEPCTAFEGNDPLGDCLNGAVCWDVDPRTNMGTCTPSCANEECAEPDTFCLWVDGAYFVCVPACNPLMADCDEDDACYPVDDLFTCAPDASDGMGAYGDPCEFINSCAPGLFCVDQACVPGCLAQTCCSPVCNVSDQNANQSCLGFADGQVCESWWEGPPPMGYEDVGVCCVP